MAVSPTGRPWAHDRDAHGVLGWIRTWDATHGRNGWHPHLHMVLFVSGAPAEADVAHFEDRLHERWTRAVQERGHRSPSREHGIRLERATLADDGALARYLMKIEGERSGGRVALELMRGDLKAGRAGGRTPLDVLSSFLRTGDLADLDLWREWERVTRGRRFSVWSRGLKARVEVEDRDDQDIMEDEVGGVTLHRFTRSQWTALSRRPGAQALLLDIAEKEGELAVRRYLSTYPPAADGALLHQVAGMAATKT